MSELNRVIEERLAAAEAGVAAAPRITVDDDEPDTAKTGDLWITTGGTVSIFIDSTWAQVQINVS